jgi:hypothetical protein|tara:strand:- start:42 stop:317 length:276 start_codon:yes stop_codon:yes gene_type:complete
MAFTRSSLARIGTANSDAGAVWIYKSADAIGTVRAANYFLGAVDEIKLNDILFLVTSTGGTPAVTISYCNSNTGTAIDITDGTTISATDSD